jgi:hypothetical protein
MLEEDSETSITSKLQHQRTCSEGAELGILLGSFEGMLDGCSEGAELGTLLGSFEGMLDG